MQKDGAAAAVRLLLLACTPRPPSSSDETAARLDLWQDAATRPNNDDTPLVTLPSYEKHLFNRTPIFRFRCPFTCARLHSRPLTAPPLA